MKIQPMILIALAIASGCVSNHQKEGNFNNPYANVDFSVVNSPLTLKRIDSITVPEITFQDTDIEDVIHWIVDFSELYEAKHGKKGVRYLVPYGNYPIHGQTPKITFTAADVSLLEVIKTTATISGLDYVIYDKDMLEFRDRKANNSAYPSSQGSQGGR